MGFYLLLSRLYYQYIPEGKEYPVLSRRLKSGNNGWLNTLLSYTRGQLGMEQILLDWNQIAEQYGKLLFHLHIHMLYYLDSDMGVRNGCISLCATYITKYIIQNTTK